MTWTSQRITALEQQQAKRKSFAADAEHYNFRVAVSCPPDTRIYMRGGLMWEYYNTGNGWFVEDTTFDLADPTDTGFPAGFTFNTANYYHGYYLRLANGGPATPYTIQLLSDGAEYATAAEAEDAILAYAGLGWAWGDDYPLCGLVARNNGVTGTPGQLMPIDTINRGRSYLWPRDFRPRTIAV